MKNQFKVKNLPNPTLIQDAVTKYYVDKKTLDLVDDTTIVRTNKNNDFKGNAVLGCESVYVTRDPKDDLELSTKNYIDTSIDAISLVKNIKLNPIFLLTTDPTKQFDDYEKDNIVPKSVISEFVTTTVDEMSMLRLEQEGEDSITLQDKLTIPLDKNLARTDRDIDFNNFRRRNIGDDINVVNRRYVDSGLKQDGKVLDTSNIVPIIINTASGELSFPLVTKHYTCIR